MACTAWIVRLRRYVSCGRGVGSANNRAGMRLLSCLLQKTTQRRACYLGVTHRNGTEDLGRKRPIVLLESYCLRARQRVVSDHIKEIEGENPQKLGISPEPRKCPFERRYSRLTEGWHHIVAVPAPSDLLCLLSSFHSTDTLRESETDEK